MLMTNFISNYIPQRWWDFTIAVIGGFTIHYIYSVVLIRANTSLTSLLATWNYGGVVAKALFELPLLATLLYVASRTFESRTAFAFGIFAYVATIVTWYLVYLLTLV